MNKDKLIKLKAQKPGFINFLFILPGMLSGFLLLVFTACAQSPTQAPLSPGPSVTFEISTEPVDNRLDPASIPARKDNPCPGLDNLLYDLTQAKDPLAQAELAGLTVKDGKVQVLFVLGSEDFSFLKDYGVELGSHSGNQVQGFTSIDKLCELARLDSVLTISLPAKAILP